MFLYGEHSGTPLHVHAIHRLEYRNGHVCSASRSLFTVLLSRVSRHITTHQAPWLFSEHPDGLLDTEVGVGVDAPLMTMVLSVLLSLLSPLKPFTPLEPLRGFWKVVKGWEED